MKRIIATTLAAAVLCTSVVTAAAAGRRQNGNCADCGTAPTFSQTMAFGAAGAAQTEPADDTSRLCAFQGLRDFGAMPNGRMGQMPAGNGQRPDRGQAPDGAGSATPDGQQFQRPDMSQGQSNGQQGQMPNGQQNQQNQQFGGQMPGMNSQSTVTSADSASAIVTGETTNSAASLAVNESAAKTITVTNTNSLVKISNPGTYIITGSASNGSITVKKGVTGVVLILKDLDLTSTTGAPLAINKDSQVKVVISGTVTLTDAEDPDDEDSAYEAVADAYDGAAIKVKAGASAVITGTGTLNLNGTAKNGIKAGDDTVLVIDGPTVNINAANDGINGNYDVALLSGTVTVSAGDDGIHADRILTIGSDSTSPTVTVKSSTEGLEGTVVNIVSGTVDVTASDDAINAGNSDDAYSELTCSINQTGGAVTVNCRGDGYDSNGNINLVSGSASISSASTGGEAGLDYVGSLYVSDDFQLDNRSGVSSDAMMGGRGGMMGQMPGQQNQQGSTQQNRQTNRQTPDVASGATARAA